MRLEALPLRTWLLGSVAVWSLAVWLATLSGAGTRLPALGKASDPAPLPHWQAATLAAASNDHAAIRQQPLFETDRQPHPFVIGGNNADAASRTLDVVLTGVLITPRLRMATLQPSNANGANAPASLRVREGETVPGSGWTLIEVSPRSVVVEGPGGRQTLELRVYASNAATVPPVARSQTASVASNASAPAEVKAASASVTAPAPLAGAAQDQQQQQQLQAIRDRIAERRRQMQQIRTQGAGAPSNPMP